MSNTVSHTASGLDVSLTPLSFFVWNFWFSLKVGLTRILLTHVCSLPLLVLRFAEGLGGLRSLHEAQILSGSGSDSDEEGPVYGGRSDDEGVYRGGMSRSSRQPLGQVILVVSDCLLGSQLGEASPLSQHWRCLSFSLSVASADRRRAPHPTLLSSRLGGRVKPTVTCRTDRRRKRRTPGRWRRTKTMRLSRLEEREFGRN